MSQPVSLSSDTDANVTRPSGGSDSRALASVQSLIIGILAVVLIVSLSINYLFLHQQRSLRKEVDASLGLLERMEKQFAETDQVTINTLVGNLIVFSRTAPDFVPILEKYRLLRPTAASAAPAPAKAAAPKTNPPAAR